MRFKHELFQAFHFISWKAGEYLLLKGCWGAREDFASKVEDLYFYFTPPPPPDVMFAFYVSRTVAASSTVEC